MYIIHIDQYWCIYIYIYIICMKWIEMVFSPEVWRFHVLDRGAHDGRTATGGKAPSPSTVVWCYLSIRENRKRTAIDFPIFFEVKTHRLSHLLRFPVQFSLIPIHWKVSGHQFSPQKLKGVHRWFTVVSELYRRFRSWNRLIKMHSALGTPSHPPILGFSPTKSPSILLGIPHGLDSPIWSGYGNPDCWNVIH